MRASELADFLAETLHLKSGTVLDYQKHLRGAGLLSRGLQGPYGGAHMTSSDATNSLLANLIEHKRGDSIAANVRRMRSIPFVDKSLLDSDYAGCLSFSRASSLGDAIDALIDDMRSGAYQGFEQLESYPLSTSLTIDSANAEGFVLIMRKRALAGAGTWYFRHGQEVHIRPTWKHTHVDGQVFIKLANALGRAPAK